MVAKNLLLVICQAKAILLRAEATSEGLRRIADAIKESPCGTDAVALTVAEKYVEAFGQLAKQGNTIIVPANSSDAGSMIAQIIPTIGISTYLLVGATPGRSQSISCVWVKQNIISSAKRFTRT
ncbi:hypothetical protein Glove_402g33 [Diversispora epigaea]|uniref:STML2-like C-terminal extension domain-containing protein n=1 Tax=Diversispora epigaea TaxID=1348612 RepID=A0A397H3Y8_9GLOM|nr:hypothetical protein Glove_402g33 [Diversispora epigaea]